jgi:hypothetical protein
MLVSLSETKSELETLSNKVEKAAAELKNTDEDDSASPFNKKMEVSYKNCVLNIVMLMWCTIVVLVTCQV